MAEEAGNRSEESSVAVELTAKYGQSKGVLFDEELEIKAVRHQGVEISKSQNEDIPFSNSDEDGEDNTSKNQKRAPRGWSKVQKTSNGFLPPILRRPIYHRLNQVSVETIAIIYPYINIHKDRVALGQTSSNSIQAYFKIRCTRYKFGRPLTERTRKTWITIWNEFSAHWRSCKVPYCTNAGRTLAALTAPSSDTSKCYRTQPEPVNIGIQHYIQQEGQVGPDKFLNGQFRTIWRRVAREEIKQRLLAFLRSQWYDGPARPLEDIRDHPCLAWSFVHGYPATCWIIKVDVRSSHWGQIRYGHYHLFNPDGITLFDLMHSVNLSMTQKIDDPAKIPIYHRMIDESENRNLREVGAYECMKSSFVKILHRVALRTRPRSVFLDITALQTTDETRIKRIRKDYTRWERTEIWLSTQPEIPVIDKFSHWSGRVFTRRDPWEHIRFADAEMEIPSSSALPNFVLPQMETPPPTEPLYHQPATPTTFQSTPYTTPGSSLPQTPFSSNAAPGPSSSRRAPGGFGPIIDAEDDEEPITTGYASSGTRYSPPQKPEGYVAVPKRRKWTNIQEIFALGPNIQPDPFGSHSFGGPLDIKEISNPLSDEYCGANVLLTSMHKDTSTTVTAYPYAPQGGGHPGCCAI